MDKSVCEEKNYQSLYAEHSANLRNFMYYKCGDLEKAEDFTHEAFIKLWEKCKDVIFDKAKSFVFTVANRLFLNHVEHQKVVLNFNKENKEEAKAEDPAFILQGKEFQNKLEQCIAALPEGQREVFLMNRIDKLSYKEIAQTLDVSVKAVEKRMAKALQKLRTSLKEIDKNRI